MNLVWPWRLFDGASLARDHCHGLDCPYLLLWVGLGFGSWASGRWLPGAREGNRNLGRFGFIALFEFLIGLSALVVPYELSWGAASARGCERFFGRILRGGGFLGCVCLWGRGCADGGDDSCCHARDWAGVCQRGGTSFSYLYTAEMWRGAVMGRCCLCF